MPNKDFETPSSDFDRREEKEKKLNESLKTGEGIYLKGEKKNAKEKS